MKLDKTGLRKNAGAVIDANVSLGRWPFQRFSAETAGELSRHLEVQGIQLGVAASVEAALFPDPFVCNKALLRSARRFKNILPLATVNPLVANWEDNARLAEAAGWARAVKILPGYHGYKLSAKPLLRLAEKLTRRDLGLVVQARLEDERSHFHRMRIPPVRPAEVIGLAGRFPSLRVLSLCGYINEIAALAGSKTAVSVEISFAERLNTLEELLKVLPANRVFFGSHTPFFYTAAALMKLRAARAAAADLRAVAHGNARRFFGIKG